MELGGTVVQNSLLWGKAGSGSLGVSHKPSVPSYIRLSIV